jgi:hypothetical protein
VSWIAKSSFRFTGGADLTAVFKFHRAAAVGARSRLRQSALARILSAD